MASLADDVYDSAKGIGDAPVGWMRGGEDFDQLRRSVPQLYATKDAELAERLRPRESGFRAEIYIPDPAILGPGYKPTVVYKGSAGEVATANGLRDTSAEDFLANNFPQSVGMQTDYYDRAMQLAATLKEQRVDFEIAGHSLGGGMGSAASAVSGAPATTFNAAGLHPVTAQRFALANGLPTYDTANTVVAYQVQGEMLNNGIQDNIHRLDAARRQQLAAVMGDTATLMRSLPEGQALLDHALTRDVPVNAQPAVHAFVDRLAQGDTAQLLQQLPLAAGRIEPVLPAKMQGQDGALVDRAQALTLQESLYLAGPALGVLRAGAAGAQIGRGLGEYSAALGRAGDAALDAAGDGAARGMQMGGAAVRHGGSATGAALEAGGATLGRGLAAGRAVAGELDASAQRWAVQAQAQAQAQDTAAVALRGAARWLPDTAQAALLEQAQALERQAQADRQQAEQHAARLREDSARQAETLMHTTAGMATAAADRVRTASALPQQVLDAVGGRLNRTLDASGDALAGLTAHAPSAGALEGALLAAGAATQLRFTPSTPHNLGNVAQTATLSVHGQRSLHEALERHLMTETVVPSLQARIDAEEQQARQVLGQGRTAAQQDPHAPTALRTGDADIDAMLQALRNHDEAGVFKAAERIRHSPEGQALLQEGQALMQQREQEAVTNQVTWTPADMQPADVQMAHGPVRVMSLMHQGPAMAAADSGGGDGGGGGGGGGGSGGG
ncbi:MULTISPECIES: phospholipase [Xanthomonas]|uniref:phospholipase n=2 Tax=Xanthomonas TaxID=338 RepID=UPI00096DDB52|nr:phospholipase [Xanthomonas campestris]MEA9611658.1 phospholipase [Xanthomonas campestris pv. incanae]MEA9617838.1 phospholipase [Xanthomonas campestris pv. incanae]RFF43880.1 phospholipase [Xanthomonas campestris pv. incanae]WDJ10168.1 phospholipase [Xanthomonas campestris pv. incanae]